MGRACPPPTRAWPSSRVRCPPGPPHRPPRHAWARRRWAAADRRTSGGRPTERVADATPLPRTAVVDGWRAPPPPPPPPRGGPAGARRGRAPPRRAGWWGTPRAARSAPGAPPPASVTWPRPRGRGDWQRHGHPHVPQVDVEHIVTASLVGRRRMWVGWCGWCPRPSPPPSCRAWLPTPLCLRCGCTVQYSKFYILYSLPAAAPLPATGSRPTPSPLSALPPPP